MGKIYGNTIGGVAPVNVFELELDDGTVLNGVVTEEPPVITATANDVRKGKTVILSDGLVEGTKKIPSYETTTGYSAVTPGSMFSIKLPLNDAYNYTKLQCVIAPFNVSLPNSVAVDKISLNDNVYATGSTESLAVVSKNSTKKSIDFNITNNTDKNYVIHYFTYKEEE
jgi:hypothetical protein